MSQGKQSENLLWLENTHLLSKREISTVRLTSCFTGLDSIKQVNLLSINISTTAFAKEVYFLTLTVGMLMTGTNNENV